jgi:hypothetical protein
MSQQDDLGLDHRLRATPDRHLGLGAREAMVGGSAYHMLAGHSNTLPALLLLVSAALYRGRQP